MNRKIIINAEIVSPYRILKGYSVVINGTKIAGRVYCGSNC